MSNEPTPKDHAIPLFLICIATCDQSNYREKALVNGLENICKELNQCTEPMDELVLTAVGSNFILACLDGSSSWERDCREQAEMIIDAINGAFRQLNVDLRIPKAKYGDDLQSLYINEARKASYGKPSSPSSSNSSSGGGCYVATAVYGSYDCPQVWTLRRFRDYKLAKTWYGRAFVKSYYAVSPTIVRYFGNAKWFNKLWRGKLDSMVSSLQSKGYESTPYDDIPWK